MTTPSAPTSPLAERRTETALGVNETVAQAFRSAAHAFQVQAAGLFREVAWSPSPPRAGS